LPDRVRIHGGSYRCCKLRRDPLNNDNYGVILPIDNHGVNWGSWRKRKSDGHDISQDRGGL
jgi:hypothetical protein